MTTVTSGPGTRAAVESFQHLPRPCASTASAVPDLEHPGSRPVSASVTASSYRQAKMLRGGRRGRVANSACAPLGFDAGRVDGIFGDHTAHRAGPSSSATPGCPSNGLVGGGGPWGRNSSDWRTRHLDPELISTRPGPGAELRDAPTNPQRRHVAIGESGRSGQRDRGRCPAPRPSAAPGWTELPTHPDDSTQAQQAKRTGRWTSTWASRLNPTAAALPQPAFWAGSHGPVSGRPDCWPSWCNVVPGASTSAGRRGPGALVAAHPAARRGCRLWSWLRWVRRTWWLSGPRLLRLPSSRVLGPVGRRRLGTEGRAEVHAFWGISLRVGTLGLRGPFFPPTWDPQPTHLCQATGAWIKPSTR